MIWFTADEHYYHYNIIKYCHRPFSTLEEMDRTLVKNFNSVVGKEDTTYHLGDFCFRDFFPYVKDRMAELNGHHVFIKGSHDKWTRAAENEGFRIPYMKEIRVDSQTIVLCHYAMRRWPKSHFSSWHLYGHSHGQLPTYGLSFDVGVDCNNFFPLSFEEIRERMGKLEPIEKFF